eukprot:TRINITY_DN5604_c0_g2_i1.p1 TRINITY_DN5604_c0_g2~~TRINITY_DN5604_c0_g2_i1.p1  ORF type:complete len:127 (-),score=20.29 TRINITY_DN5604_c0_g2_i1:50-430(-)
MEQHMSNQHYFTVACETGDVNEVDRLLQMPGVNARFEGNYAIGIAASNGHSAVVDRLLREPYVADVANYAIQLAAKNGHLAVVDRLLQVPGLDVTADNNSAIRLAAENGHVAVVERLSKVPGVRME